MITRQSDKTLKQSENFPSTAFGIKETGLSHIFNVLRNQLYSDKILAVIREYSANAIDAHAEIGKKDTPIHVALPNKLSLHLKIRDYGRGLTENEIREIYAMYGESTKRGTNEQIGQLGLGCKSAFAYGDNFVINSFVNGTKTSYNAFIDPSEIGQIAKLSSEDSNEKSGIEIVVPVKQEDCETFYRKAVDLFKYYEVTPNVTGVDPSMFKKDIALGDVIIEGGNWRIHKDTHDSHSHRNQSDDSIVVMGNIAYPLDKNALDIVWNGGEDMRIKDDLLESGLVIRVNIGEFDITANRESLEYTKSTKKKIHSIIEEILEEIPTLMGQKFSDCKTLYEAKALYYDAFRQGGFGQRLENIAKSKGVVWNGIKVKDAYFRRESFKESEVNFISFAKPNNWSKAKRVKPEQTKHIICDKGILLIESDTLSSVGRLNRIAPLLEDYDTRDKDAPKYASATLVTFGSDIQKSKWKKDVKFDGEMVKLSSLPKVKLRDIYPSNSSVSSNSVKSTKHTSKEFLFDFEHSGNKYSSVRSDFFTEDAIDLDKGGYYIGIDKFFVMDRLTENQELHPYCMSKFKKHFEKIGLTFPKKIHAFKKAKWEKIKAKKGWVCLFDYMEESVLKFLEKDNNKQKYVDYIHADNHFKGDGQHPYGYDKKLNTEIVEMFHKLKKSHLNKVIAEDSVFLEYYNAYLRMSECDKWDKDMQRNNGVFATLHSFASQTFKMLWSSDARKKMNSDKILKENPTFNLKSLNHKFFKTYSMFRYVDDVFYGYRFKEDAEKNVFSKEMANYINIVDVTVLHKKNKPEDNIFSVAEQIGQIKGKIEEQKKRIAQKVLDTRPTVN
jgi:hypothetical protein